MIVGIVGACAGVLIAAENLAGQQPAGDHAIGAVLVARDPLEDGVDVVLVERRSLAVRTADRRLRVDRCVLRDRRSSGTIPPGCSRAPRKSSSRSRPLPWRLPRNTADRTGGTTSRPWRRSAVKPGWAPEVFSLISTHFDGSGGVPTLGRAMSSSLRDWPGADPVRKPARVRHLVDGVDVLRAQPARLVS